MRGARLHDTAAALTRAYVVHPDLKTTRKRRLAEHGLAEAVALAAALPGLEVVGSEVARLNKLQPGTLFGSGKVEELQEVDELVTYPQTFDVRNLADEMDNAQRMSVINAPKALRRKQMKRVANKMFPQADAAEIKEIEDDIDNDWLETPELDVAGAIGEQPTLGKGRVPGKGNSQGENNKGSVKADDKAGADKRRAKKVTQPTS